MRKFCLGNRILLIIIPKLESLWNVMPLFIESEARFHSLSVSASVIRGNIIMQSPLPMAESIILSASLTGLFTMMKSWILLVWLISFILAL